MLQGKLEPEAALIDASVVMSPLVVEAAGGVALRQQEKGGLKTKSLHAELVFGLSGSKHVGCVSCFCFGCHCCETGFMMSIDGGGGTILVVHDVCMAFSFAAAVVAIVSTPIYSDRYVLVLRCTTMVSVLGGADWTLPWKVWNQG